MALAKIWLAKVVLAELGLAEVPVNLSFPPPSLGFAPEDYILEMPGMAVPYYMNC